MFDSDEKGIHESRSKADANEKIFMDLGKDFFVCDVLMMFCSFIIFPFS